MKQLLSIILFGLAVLVTTIAGPQKTERDKQTFTPLRTKARKEQVIARLNQTIPRLMKDGDVPGLSVALIRDGELVWHRGFGVTNAKTNEPVTDKTVFEAASLSKPVFAYAVLKLIDAGKLELDKPVTYYLPGNYDVGEDPRLDQITVRRVLSHTTGFPNWRSGTLKIHFTPGERFSYSGEGYVYLAKAVEHTTGEKLNDFMKKVVFDPLGMTDSSFIWQDSYDKLKTFRHDSIGQPVTQNKPAQGQANAAASLHTTARDYGLFVSAILKGVGLKKETLRLMLEPQIKVGEGGTNHTSRPPEKLSPNISWGLGWGLQTTGDGLSFWHWGDNGDSKAYVVAFEKQKLGVVFFANGATGLSITREIVDEAVGGEQPALSWLNYESYNSPARLLFKNILAKGAEASINEYRQWRKGRAAGEVVKENQMNSLGYRLLRLQRVKDAIEVFKLNVEDYPQSYNTYDSLGGAYMVNGDKELAIKNYERSVELNPNNTGGIEMLKKLRENKDD